MRYFAKFIFAAVGTAVIAAATLASSVKLAQKTEEMLEKAKKPNEEKPEPEEAAAEVQQNEEAQPEEETGEEE